MIKEAVIEDQIWRYELRRIWDQGLPVLVVIMLNPSTADDRRDDPTILALIHFAKLWGYGSLLIVNFFAFRSSKPQALKPDLLGFSPIGPRNGEFLDRAMQEAGRRSGLALAAWGACGAVDPALIEPRQAEIEQLADRYQVDLVCLGRTAGGAPKHPMARGKHRIPRDQQPILWREAA